MERQCSTARLCPPDPALPAGRIMRPLVEALRAAGRSSTSPVTGPRTSGKAPKGSDPFGGLMAVISLLLFGAVYTGEYHPELMSDFIQCGGQPHAWGQQDSDKVIAGIISAQGEVNWWWWFLSEN